MEIYKCKINNRNINLDLIRAFAVISVLSVHFFMNTNFYSALIIGKRMYVMTIIQTFFMICVPLFIILTGYLMNKKRFTKAYYYGIIKTLWTYFVCGVICIVFKNIYGDKDIGICNAIKQLFDFSAAPYAWYIEMYIGLFLIIPFLNLAYNGLESKKKKIALLATMILITVMPSVFNIEFKILPDWWMHFYPITYYFIGAYLNEYNVKIHTKLNIILIIVFTILAGTFNIYKSYNNVFVWSGYNDWNGFQNAIRAVLVFILLNNIELKKVPDLLKSILINISKCSLGIYLISYIFDSIIYDKFNNMVLDVPERIYFFVPVVISVFIASWMVSNVINFTYIPIKAITNKMKNLNSKTL